MSRKFGGKCLFYSPRTVPEEARTGIELGELNGFDLEKNSPALRDGEPDVMMRKRKEGGWRADFRRGEANGCRLTTTYIQASFIECSHRRRDNDHWRA